MNTPDTYRNVVGEKTLEDAEDLLLYLYQKSGTVKISISTRGEYR
jgi:hypothetical protein